jgi:hypothetical protein
MRGSSMRIRRQEEPMSARLSTRVALVAAIFALAAPAAARAAFSVVPSPNANVGASALNSVAAGSATDAWAVGWSCCAARNFGEGTLTEHWNGSAWSIVPSPDTRFNDEVLNSVAAISPGNAWAVGDVKQGGYRSGAPLILHWDGAAWQTVAPPSGTTGTLLTVAATGPSDVWAAGDDNHGHPLVLRFNGVAWSRSAVPQFGSSDHLRGVRAFAPNDVWIVGDDSGGNTLVIHWNGAAWTRVPSPSPDPNTNTLHAVGGVSSRDFWAVGQSARSKTSTGVPPGTRTLAMHWNGSAWTTVASPNIGDEDSLRGVVANGGAVTAVGAFQSTSTGAQRTLAERWGGSSWAVRPTPNVGDADHMLRGVSPIPGTGDVWVVGAHLTSGGPEQTLVLRGF